MKIKINCPDCKRTHVLSNDGLICRACEKLNIVKPLKPQRMPKATIDQIYDKDRDCLERIKVNSKKINKLHYEVNKLLMEAKKAKVAISKAERYRAILKNDLKQIIK